MDLIPVNSVIEKKNNPAFVKNGSVFSFQFRGVGRDRRGRLIRTDHVGHNLCDRERWAARSFKIKKQLRVGIPGGEFFCKLERKTRLPYSPHAKDSDDADPLEAYLIDEFVEFFCATGEVRRRRRQLMDGERGS
jgi:hypothetical protein